ncbi:MAG: hypothetical protein LBJ47_06965 [Tannerella sp.]|nr:hypothetical protein [Tannerella sp.]
MDTQYNTQTRPPSITSGVSLPVIASIAKQSRLSPVPGLLRYARNDGEEKTAMTWGTAMLPSPV